MTEKCKICNESLDKFVEEECRACGYVHDGVVIRPDQELNFNDDNFGDVYDTVHRDYEDYQ